MVNDATQCAWIILAAESIPAPSRRTRVSPLAWRSSRLKRRTSSTLAGEILALSQSLAEVEFLQVLLHDVTYNHVIAEDWRRALRPMSVLIRSNPGLAPRSPAVHLVDAKSVYDAVFKDAVAGRQDRRSAVELAVIGEVLRMTGGQVRWIPHQKMPADPMTHEDIGRASQALLDLLKTGTLTVIDENTELMERSASSHRKSRTAAASSRRLAGEREGAEDSLAVLFPELS